MMIQNNLQYSIVFNPIGAMVLHSPEINKAHRNISHRETKPTSTQLRSDFVETSLNNAISGIPASEIHPDLIRLIRIIKDVAMDERLSTREVIQQAQEIINKEEERYGRLTAIEGEISKKVNARSDYLISIDALKSMNESLIHLLDQDQEQAAA